MRHSCHEAAERRELFGLDERNSGCPAGSGALSRQTFLLGSPDRLFAPFALPNLFRGLVTPPTDRLVRATGANK